MTTNGQLKDDKWIKGWTKFMIEIWKEKINQVGARDTDALFHSVDNFKMEGNKDSFEITHSFLDYGLFVDRGVGKEFNKGNSGNVISERQELVWFRKRYYSSYMNMKSYLALYYKNDYIMMMKEALEG